MRAVAGPKRLEPVDEFLELNQDLITGNVSLVHKSTQTSLKTWAAVVGLEEGAWIAMEAYAERVKGFQAVNWSADERDFLFPCENFVSRYLDPVGMGEKTMAEASAHLMEKIMREAV